MVQNCGVANATTNGAFSLSASATDTRSSSRSGGFWVERASRSPPVLASVGVSEAMARSPIDGALLRSATTTFPSAWIFRPPIGSARIQYLPGSGISSRVTKIAPASASSEPSIPIGSEVAVVSRNGFRSSPRASQTRAFGRVTTCPCPPTTRNENRTEPGSKSAVPGTIATSSPGARQSASSEPAEGSSTASVEEPPHPVARRKRARTRGTTAGCGTRRV